MKKNRRFQQNASSLREPVVLLVLGVMIFGGLAGVFFPGPMPVIPNVRADSCTPTHYDVVVDTFQRWTPYSIVNSPVFGQATGYNGQSTSITFSPGVTSSTNTGWRLSPSNGDSSGHWYLLTWNTHHKYTISGCCSCYYQDDGYYQATDFTSSTDAGYDLAPPGTTDDSTLPTQFTYNGYQSITFHVGFDTSQPFHTEDTKATSTPQTFDVSGSSGVFMSISVSVGNQIVSVGVASFTYQTGSAYDYSYTFPPGYVWNYQFLGGSNYLMAFQLVTNSPPPSGGGGGCVGSSCPHPN